MPDPISSPISRYAGIAHPAPVVLHVADALVGGPVAGVSAQFAQHVVDAPFGERRADLLRPGLAQIRAGAVHGAPHFPESLLGVPDVDDA